MLKGSCNISIHKRMTAPNQPISWKKLGADPCTQPPCRPTLDGSHVSKKPITRSGEVGLNFGGSTFVGLLPTTPDRVMVILGHVAYIQDGSTWKLGARVCTQFFSHISGPHFRFSQYLVEFYCC